MSANDGERGASPAKLSTATSEWFDEYLGVLDACGRGTSDDERALLRYHTIPLLLTSDAEAITLATEAEVLEAIHWQVQALRAVDFQRTESLERKTTALNTTSFLHETHLSRRRADGSEIGRVRATFLITIGADGPGIAMLAMQSPEHRPVERCAA